MEVALVERRAQPHKGNARRNLVFPDQRSGPAHLRQIAARLLVEESEVMRSQPGAAAFVTKTREAPFPDPDAASKTLAPSKSRTSP